MIQKYVSEFAFSEYIHLPPIRPTGAMSLPPKPPILLILSIPLKPPIPLIPVEKYHQSKTYSPLFFKKDGQ